MFMQVCVEAALADPDYREKAIAVVESRGLVRHPSTTDNSYNVLNMQYNPSTNRSLFRKVIISAG